jgi:UDP-N-acetylmuramyl pentapeptide phosphotransferase/UDP-N-acetylglucosamine-1-phosphate transferase
MPLLRRYALARPNARSSHAEPTPQGGGIAIVAAVCGILVLVLALSPGFPPQERLSLCVLVGATLVLATLGALDDIRPLPALPRLTVQLAAVGAVVYWVPAGDRLLPDAVPLHLERVLVAVAGVWFVNLVNFMDGLDWMTFAGLGPAAAGLVLLAWAGAAPVAAGLLAVLVLGGMVGFAPFNKPPARLFLGDVGSLPIGLLLGYALYRLAGNGQVLSALILPLYYVADATITLCRRLLRGEWPVGSRRDRTGRAGQHHPRLHRGARRPCLFARPSWPGLCCSRVRRRRAPGRFLDPAGSRAAECLNARAAHRRNRVRGSPPGRRSCAARSSRPHRRPRRAGPGCGPRRD